MADLKLNFKANFDKAKDKANDYVKHLQKKMKAGGGGIGGGLLGGVLGGAVAGAAIAGVTKAFQTISRAARAAVSHVKDTAVYMDNIAKASRRINWDVGDFQKVQYAVERTGGSFENIERAYKKFQIQYSRLFDKVPSAEVKGLFEKLGLSKEDMANMKSVERFMLVSRRLMQIEDPDLRSGVANRLFGQGGSKLLPAMRELQPLIGRFLSEDFGFSKEDTLEAERVIDLLGDLARSIALLTAESGAIKLFADSVNYMLGVTQSARNMAKGNDFQKSSRTQKAWYASKWMLKSMTPLGAIDNLRDLLGTEFVGRMIEGPGFKAKIGKGKGKNLGLDADQSDDMAAKAMRLEKMASDQFLNVGRQLTSVAGIGQANMFAAIADNTKRTADAVEVIATNYLNGEVMGISSGTRTGPSESLIRDYGNIFSGGSK